MSARNHLLDGMRGLAALCVVLLHLGTMLHLDLAPGGYLAVDFFFSLSGYVIAAAYDRRLAQGLTAGRFLAMRVVRLYPLFLVGIVLGFGKSLAQTLLHTSFYLTPARLALATAVNALMLPYPLPYLHIFPLNAPAWSLSFEMLVNIAYALLLVRLGRGPLLALVALAGAAIVAGPVLLGNSGLVEGNQLPTIGFGLARVLFSFPLGMLVARLPGGGKRARRYASLGVAAVLVLVLLVPMPANAVTARDLLFVLVASPLLLWASARMEVPRWAERGSALLGDLSYPLYIGHYPILLAVVLLGTRLHLSMTVQLLCGLGAAVVAALALEHWYDRPVRRWLSDRLHLSQSAKPQVM